LGCHVDLLSLRRGFNVSPKRRLGGKEFAVFLAGTGPERTRLVCECIQLKAKAVCGAAGLRPYEITINIGAFHSSAGAAACCASRLPPTATSGKVAATGSFWTSLYKRRPDFFGRPRRRGASGHASDSCAG
jgi:hypothetical protein